MSVPGCRRATTPPAASIHGIRWSAWDDARQDRGPAAPRASPAPLSGEPTCPRPLMATASRPRLRQSTSVARDRLEQRVDRLYCYPAAQAVAQTGCTAQGPRLAARAEGSRHTAQKSRDHAFESRAAVHRRGRERSARLEHRGIVALESPEFRSLWPFQRSEREREEIRGRRGGWFNYPTDATYDQGGRGPDPKEPRGGASRAAKKRGSHRPCGTSLHRVTTIVGRDSLAHRPSSPRTRGSGTCAPNRRSTHTESYSSET